MSVSTLGINELVTVGCLLWFVFCWVGYTTFARRQAKQRKCIASVMHRHRISWIERLVYRENFIADTALLASLERQVTFFASTTILILAALLTLLGTSESLFSVLDSMPHTIPFTMFDVQIRLMLMISIFIFAFFTFTWSMRQYGFCSVLMGACPTVTESTEVSSEHRKYIVHLAKIIDHAGHSYNYGLRSYYFAMSTLAWFIHPLAFVVSTASVVLVLYQREFHSNTLNVMDEIDKHTMEEE